MLKKRKFSRFITLFVVMTAIFLFTMISVEAATTKILNMNYSPFNFSAGTFINSGDQSTPGSQYKYTNVATVDGVSIDAIITIKQISKATINTMDDDSASVGSPDRFNPIITSSAGNNTGDVGYVIYDISFFDHSDGSDVYVENFKLTGIDIDGATNYQEINEISGFVSITTNSKSDGTYSSGLTISTSGTSISGATRIKGINSSLSGVSFDNTASYIADYIYPVHSLNVLLGAINNASSRQFSINIGNAGGAFRNPVTIYNLNIPQDTTVTVNDDDGLLNRDDNINAVPVSGTVSNCEGGIVIVTATDQNNNSVSATATVNSGGYTTALDMSGLNAGTITITANPVDVNGNPGPSASDSTDKIAQYTVNFDMQGGDTSIPDQTVYQGENAIEPVTIPNKYGFNFTGWYTDSSYSTAFDFTSPIISKTSIFAGWVANNNPTATDDIIAAAINEDTPATISASELLANDTDTDGDTLTVTSVSPTSVNGGTVSFDSATGEITYTPAADFNGEDNFTYTVSDGNGGADTAMVNVTVTGVNDDPIAVDDTASATEDTPATITATELLANDSDVDGDTLIITGVSPASANGGTVSFDSVTGKITYTPAADFSGTDTFTYTISDGNGGTNTGTVTVTVAAVNDEPIVENDIATVNEDESKDIAVLANDSDADGDIMTVSVAVGDGPAHGTVTINPDNTIKYTPDADYNGDDSFTYTVSDGNGGTKTGTVTITVTAVNDNPTAADDTITASINEDTPAKITASDLLVNDTDTDGDLLTVTGVSPASTNGGTVSFDSVTGKITYTPAADFNGDDSFTYTVIDGNGGTDTAVVNVSVTGVNDDPTSVNDNVNATEDTSATIGVNELLANDSDVDGDTLTVTGVSPTSANGGTVSFNSASGEITYTPAADFSGTDTFTYTISDGNGGTNTGTVTVTVAAVNDAPNAKDDTATVNEGESKDIAVLANDSDADGDILTVSVAEGDGPAHGIVIVNSDNTIKYTPNDGYSGEDSFTYTVSDGNGGTASKVVTVTVVAESDIIEAKNDNTTTAEDTALSIKVANLLANDVYKNTLTVISVDSSSSMNGKVVLNKTTGVVTYIPPANFNGTDSFNYTVSDGNGSYATAKVIITVSAVNDAPVANNDTVYINSGIPTIINILHNDYDVDGDILTVISVTGAKYGTVKLNPDGTVTYTPNMNFAGTDTFYYTISDRNGLTATAAVTVNVASQPVFVNSADLAVAIQASSMKPDYGDTVTFTVTYVNKSLTSVNHAYVEVKIPSGMQFVSADNNGIISGNVITWDLGILNAKEAGTITFKLKVTAPASTSDQNLRVDASINSKGTLLINTEDDTSFVSLLLQSADAEHYHKRYIKGYPDNTVRPYANITRGEIAAIFARIMNLKGTVTNKQVYSDVNVKHWAAEYIEAISAKGIFMGYPDGTFKPDQPITRAEFATVIARFLGIVKQQQLEDYIRLSGFTDTNKSWAAQNIEELFRYGIVAGYGDGTFKPDQNITRAESIKMINRMLYRGPLTDVDSSFTDNKDKTAWFFGEIEEATRSHDYVYNDNGGENLIKYIPEPLW